MDIKEQDQSSPANVQNRDSENISETVINLQTVSVLRETNDILLSLNHLTVTNLDQIESSIPPENITKFKDLKGHYISSQHNHETLSLQFETLSEQAQANPDLQDRVRRTKAHLDQIDQRIIYLENKITQMKKKGTFPLFQIDAPRYGSINIIEPSKLEILPKITTKNSPKIARLWQNMVVLIESLNLSETAAKNCILSRLEGEPAEVFEIWRMKPLVTIIRHLVNQFDQIPTRSFFIKEIDTFARREGETLRQCMSRLKTLLQGAEQYKNPEDEPLQDHIILKNSLKNSVDRTVWRKAKKAEEHCRKSDISFFIDDLIDKCEYIEQKLAEYQISSFPVGIHTQEMQVDETNSGQSSPRSPRRSPDRYSQTWRDHPFQRVEGYPHKQNYRENQEDFLLHQELSVQTDPLAAIQRLHPPPGTCRHRNCIGKQPHAWRDCRFNYRNQVHDQDF